MLPASKAVPKEMFAIVDKPLIQYAVEEAVAAGIEDVVIVLADRGALWPRLARGTGRA